MKKVKDKVAKKIDDKKNFCCPLGNIIGNKIEKIKKEVQSKTQEAKKYSKKNPEKSRNFLVFLGLLMITLLTIFIGKKRKTKKKTKSFIF